MTEKDIEFKKFDITQFKNVKKIIYQILKPKNLKIYGLVNCAGITISKNSLNYDIKNWNKTIDTNLTGPFFLCQEVSKLMIKKKLKAL